MLNLPAMSVKAVVNLSTGIFINPETPEIALVTSATTSLSSIYGSKTLYA